MTVGTQTSTVTAEGNSSTTVFSYNFVIPLQSPIPAVVEIVDTTVSPPSTTILSSSQYTITGIGNPNGGAVTYPLVGPPIGAGIFITISRVLLLTQTVSISNQGTFYPSVVESGLDTLEMQIQQLNTTLGLSVQFPLSDSGLNAVLPVAALRANLFCAFDSLGNVIAASGGGATVPISSVMVPFVQSSSLAAARTNLGLGSAAVENLSAVIVDNGTGALTIGTNQVTNAMRAQMAALTIKGNNGISTANEADLTAAQVQAMLTPPRSYLAGYQLSNDSGTPNSVLDIAAGQCTDSTNVFTITLGAFTKSTAGSWVSGSTHNGMGNGLTIATSTWYHVFAIINSGAADVYFDTSVTAANAPTNTTAFRRIGSFKTDGSAHILAFMQNEDTIWWGTQVQDVSITNLGTTALALALSVPPGVKVRPIIRAMGGLQNGTSWILTAADETDIAPSAAGTPSSVPGADYNIGSGAGVYATSGPGTPWLYTNTSQQIRARASTSSTDLYITTRGYVDSRGKLS